MYYLRTKGSFTGRTVYREKQGGKMTEPLTDNHSLKVVEGGEGEVILVGATCTMEKVV